MESVVQQLELKYNSFLKERNYEDVINSFQPAYEYLVIIETQPMVKEIIEKDRLDVNVKIQEVMAQNLPPADQEVIINRLNKSSLSFSYYEVYRDVYIPMMKYKTSLKPLSHTDLVGATKLHREKIIGTIHALAMSVYRVFKPLDEREADTALAMAKIEYTFTQRKYRIFMERIHTMIIPRLLEVCTKPEVTPLLENPKTKIIISEKNGIYSASNEQSVYPIGNRTKRFKLIKHLLSKDDCRLSELEDITNQVDTVVMNSVPEINRLFRENTGLVHDLILHNDTSGYSLNKQAFDIILEQ